MQTLQDVQTWRGMTMVDAEVPQPVCRVAVLVDVLVLGLRRGLVLAPRVAVVDDHPAFLDQFLRVVGGPSAQLHAH